MFGGGILLTMYFGHYVLIVIISGNGRKSEGKLISAENNFENFCRRREAFSAVIKGELWARDVMANVQNN